MELSPSRQQPASVRRQAEVSGRPAAAGIEGWRSQHPILPDRKDGDAVGSPQGGVQEPSAGMEPYRRAHARPGPALRQGGGDLKQFPGLRVKDIHLAGQLGEDVQPPSLPVENAVAGPLSGTSRQIVPFLRQQPAPRPVRPEAPQPVRPQVADIDPVLLRMEQDLVGVGHLLPVRVCSAALEAPGAGGGPQGVVLSHGQYAYAAVVAGGQQMPAIGRQGCVAGQRARRRLPPQQAQSAALRIDGIGGHPGAGYAAHFLQLIDAVEIPALRVRRQPGGIGRGGGDSQQLQPAGVLLQAIASDSAAPPRYDLAGGHRDILGVSACKYQHRSVSFFVCTASIAQAVRTCNAS